MACADVVEASLEPGPKETVYFHFPNQKYTFPFGLLCKRFSMLIYIKSWEATQLQLQCNWAKEQIWLSTPDELYYHSSCEKESTEIETLSNGRKNANQRVLSLWVALTH